MKGVAYRTAGRGLHTTGRDSSELVNIRGWRGHASNRKGLHKDRAGRMCFLQAEIEGRGSHRQGLQGRGFIHRAGQFPR